MNKRRNICSCLSFGAIFNNDNSYSRVYRGAVYYDSYCKTCKTNMMLDVYRKKKKVGRKRKKKSV